MLFRPLRPLRPLPEAERAHRIERLGPLAHIIKRDGHLVGPSQQRVVSHTSERACLTLVWTHPSQQLRGGRVSSRDGRRRAGARLCENGSQKERAEGCV